MMAAGILHMVFFLDCLWLLDYSQVDGLDGIEYNFTLFDLEFQYDTVTVYDGKTTSSPTLFQSSGQVAPGTYQGVSSGASAFASAFSSNKPI